MDLDVSEAAAFLQKSADGAKEETSWHTAVILGSGLGAVGNRAVECGGRTWMYAEIPGMPQPAVVGHQGRLISGSGDLSGVLFFQGRVHYYEGHDLQKITFATRLAHALGIDNLIVTNAAGGIPRSFCPGDLMVIDGHWTFLRAAEAPSGIGRTQAGRHIWNAQLSQVACSIPTSLNVHQGSYAMMSGPNYETPAEVRMLRSLGISAVGMSTVPEALAAASRGVSVLGVSCITNVASGLSEQPLDHEHVSDTASSVEAEFTDWMLALLHCISEQPAKTGD